MLVFQEPQSNIGCNITILQKDTYKKSEKRTMPMSSIRWESFSFSSQDQEIHLPLTSVNHHKKDNRQKEIPLKFNKFSKIKPHENPLAN